MAIISVQKYTFLLKVPNNNRKFAIIHYLFLPNPPLVGSFFNTYRHNFVLDTSLSVFLALLVIGFSIITLNILRISPVLRKLHPPHHYWMSVILLLFMPDTFFP